MNFLLLSGSFHQHSRSLAILKHIEVFFTGHTITTLQLNKLPFYCEDLNSDKPAVIREFIAAVDAADGILFCTPEYNHSIPAVLKNAIDWASRPAFESALKNMPVSIITQATSPVGGARAQAHLKLILDSTLSNIHPCHEMMIASVNTAFDQSMAMTDSKVLARLERHSLEFIQFAEANKKS